MKFDSVHFLSGEIDSDSVKEMHEWLLTLKPKHRALLLVDSEGGDQEEGMALYDLLKLYDLDITALALGAVKSSAVLPYLACKKRYASENTAFMFHHGTIEFNEFEKAKHQRELLEEAKEIRRLDDRYMDLIAQNTLMMSRTVRKKCRFGYFFDTKEALELGFAHEIAPPGFLKG